MAGWIAAPPAASLLLDLQALVLEIPLLLRGPEWDEVADRENAHLQRGLLQAAVAAAGWLVVVAAARRHQRDDRERRDEGA